jgi:hypothetical protein
MLADTGEVTGVDLGVQMAPETVTMMARAACSCGA